MFEERQEALELLVSIRGQALVGMALEIAIEELSCERSRFRQISNIEDMQFLLDNLFCIGKAEE